MGNWLKSLGFPVSAMEVSSGTNRRLPQMASELIRYRDLLFILAWKDIKVRYKQSIMGFLWAILMPLLIITASILVRLVFSLASGKTVTFSDSVSVGLKALPWSFFVSSIRFATTSLSANANLVSKIYFPREVLPLSAVLASLVDFGVASAAMVMVLVVGRVGISIHLVWLPVLVLLLIVLTAGLGILLSCMNLFFRDVKYLVEILLMFGILFTPVFFEARTLGKWAPILLLNPVGTILESINDVVIRHSAPNYGWVLYAACWAYFGFLVSWKIFDSAEAYFAESI